ncbi:hypothetical protein CEP52_010008 [Fusarium oligoseptatum]|uniref:Peptidase S8/S53 domain-containing protein n=1 Tax=Fusarium oligoseptatum TaxID=2604345 RepID=A0A428TAR1_9HYPO|nr:hypothetical protein CEP52_010008 [Fusarium oligoseptatum]
MSLSPDTDDDWDDDELSGISDEEISSADRIKFLESEFDKILENIKTNPNTETKEQLAKKYGTVIDQLDQQCMWLPRNLTNTPTGHTFDRFKPLIELLLESPRCNAFPSWQDNEQKETILHISTRKNHQSLIRFVCEKLEDPKKGLLELSINRLSCLHIAAQRGRPDPDLMKLLLELVNDPEADLKGMEGNTPLHLAVDIQACEPGQHKVVEVLLNACKGAVRLKNSDSLTPLQYHYKSRDSPAFNRRKKRAKRIEAMLKLNCLRLDIDRDETREILYSGTVDRREFAFDLVGYEEIRADDLNHLSTHISLETILKSVVIPDLTVHPTEDYLAAKVLAKRSTVNRAPGNPFMDQTDESYERYRASSSTPGQQATDPHEPRGLSQSAGQSIIEYDESDEAGDSDNPDEPPDCPGRIDYCWIFQWLRHQGVTKILRVSVQDRQHKPHSDQSIRWSLKGMGVEILDWNKLDICPRTIRKAAPAVRDLTLYCSGNNAVLGSWMAPGGLAKLEHLKVLNIKILQGLESLQRTAAQADRFKKKLLEERRRWCHVQHEKVPAKETPTCACHQIKVKWSIVGNNGKSVKSNTDNEDDKKAEVEKQEWIKCMERFADFIRAYRLDIEEQEAPPRIKVALIDDGVDGLNGELSSVIAAGQTFSERTNHDYNPYFKSTRGHGTIMAMLIRKICPNLRLYVAKLNEQRTGRNTMSITAESAVKAVNWAVDNKVHLISMSWTISQTTNPATIQDLVTAINRAVQNGILIFCSVSDQGPRDTGQYPARCNRDNSFLIGTATISGQAWRWNGTNEVDYILPGTDLDVQIHDELFDSRLRNVYESGSSLATALASGLAALILDCIALYDVDDLALMKEKAHARMKMALNSISPAPRSSNRDDGKYLHVWDTFGKALEDDRKRDRVKLKFVVDILMSRVRQEVGT